MSDGSNLEIQARKRTLTELGREVLLKDGDSCPTCSGSGVWRAPMAEATRREILYRRIMELWRPYLAKHPVVFVDILVERYGVDSVMRMTLEQLANLESFMRKEVQS